MSYTFEKISSNKVKLSFVVPAAEFDEEVTKSFQKNRRSIRVPGFRPGKAPRKVIENMYGEGVFYDDAIDACLQKAYTEAVTTEKIDVVDRPQVSLEEYGAGKDLKFNCEVYVTPDVELGDYTGLTVEIDHQVVSDADVDARIERDRTRQSRTVEVLDRPVEKGDTVKLDYAGTVDGVAFEGGTAKDQTLTIGSNQFIPGFEDQMIGMCVAEEKDLNVTFPEEYHAKELAGKAAVFHVKVNSISKTEMPELDDDFAADVSDFTTFAEYKESIVKELEEQAKNNNQVAAENAVVEAAVDNATVDIPEAMITDETEEILREVEMRMTYQGISMADYLKYTGQTREQMAENYKQDAQRRVKMRLVLNAIRDKEHVEASDEDVEKYIAEQAKRMGRDVEDFKKSLNEGQMASMKEGAVIDNVVALMMKDATVKDKPAESAEGKDAE